jgi:cob(I)alamin adenosyltransferase
MLSESPRTGRVQVYTGKGKGKTTCALGAGLRAAGHGLTVKMICFMKAKVAWRGDGEDINYGEFASVTHLDNFEIIPVGRQTFVDKKNPDPVDIKMAQDGLKLAQSIINNSECDVLILDEINVAVEWNLFTLEDQLVLIQNRPESMEIIMTGRYARDELIAAADLVTEMKEIKHYYESEKLMARKGFEF